MFDDLGGGGGRRIFLHRSVLFIARGKKNLTEVSHTGSPLGTLLSFISFSLLMDDESIQSLSFLFFYLIFSLVIWMDRGWESGKELLIDMCHPLCVFRVPVQQTHPSIPLTTSVSTLYTPFCVFSMI